MSLRFDNQYKQKLWDLLGDKFLDSWNESKYQFCYDDICEGLVEELKEYLKDKGYTNFKVDKVCYDDEYQRNIVYVECDVEGVIFSIENNRDVNQEISIRVDSDINSFGSTYDLELDRGKERLDVDKEVERIIEDIDEDVSDEDKLMTIITIRKEIERVNDILECIETFRDNKRKDIDDMKDSYMMDSFEYYLENYGERILGEIETLDKKIIEIEALYKKYLDIENNKCVPGV